MEPTFHQEGGGYAVHLSKGVRGLLVELCQQSRALLAAEDPSSDPAVARLFPPAYEDDPLRNLEFETNLGAAPRTGKLDAIDTVERTAHATALTEDEFLAWVGVVNDLRLVLGTRIDITEEATEEDFRQDDPRHDTFRVYQFLGYLLQEMLEAMGAPGMEEPPAGSGDSVGRGD
ncbi:MAG TPA: DUF2017 family protein [Actinomycetota bacterium]|nr:DUF2017 family protein [Actinomycetota bacterium]